MTYAAHGHAQVLTELGANVTVIASRNGSKDFECPRDLGYKIKLFDISGSGMPWSRVRGDLAGLLAHAQAERPDIAISEGWYTWGTHLLPKLRAHCRHAVISSHGSADKSIGSRTPSEIFRSIVYRYIEKFHLEDIYKSLSAAIVLTDLEDNDRFNDITQFRRRKIPVFVSSNVSIYTPAQESRQLPSIRRLLHVGEMLPHKNQLLAIELLAGLPPDYELELAFPAETWYSNQVRQLALERQVAQRVYYTVGRNRLQLEASFDNASALLVLSRTEAQPIVAVDALCKGIPFASTPVGCMREMQGGVVGLAGELRNAILSIHASPTIYAKFSATALQFYQRSYERTNSRHALQQAMNSLVS